MSEYMITVKFQTGESTRREEYASNTYSAIAGLLEMLETDIEFSESNIKTITVERIK